MVKVHSMRDAAFATLQQMRRWYFASCRESGMTVCPVCDRPGKVYANHLNAPMAFTLIWLYRNTKPGGEYKHLATASNRKVLTANKVGFLLYWGMVERAQNDDTTKGKSGAYRITQKGVRFVLRQATADRTVFTYNNDEIDRDCEQITIEDALGKKFDYTKLMEDSKP